MVFTLAGATAAPVDDAAWRRMEESKKQVTEYLVRTARAITDRAAAEIASRESWEQVRARRLEEMRDMLGLLPWPQRTPLHARVTGVLDKGDYTVEKVAFQSLPGIYVTANLYVPKRRDGPVPAIVYVCGHAYSPHGNKTSYQRHGISFAKNGYAAIILDSIQVAETFSVHHGVYGQGMQDWFARGYTPAGVEVWNAMRAMDYLATRPEVDKSRFGMTGRSGGAAMSWFTAAVDPRVKAVVPVMGISTYAANLAENTQRLHCDCMFVINSYLHDMLHQGALIAPRPLLMAHGKKDSLFPVPGYKEFEERVGTLYRDLGRPEAFANLEVETGHQDSDYLREQAIRWFDRFLKQAPGRKLDMDYSNAPEETLSVFQGKPPADARNYAVHETFTTRPPSPPFRSRASWENRRTGLLKLLRTKVFPSGLGKDSGVRKRVVAKADSSEELELSSEKGVPVRAFLRRPSKASQPVPALLYVASDQEDPRAAERVLRPQTGDWARMILYPRGVGEVGWDETFYRDTLRNAMHVGETVDSMRLFDVLLGIEALRNETGVDPQRITLAGKGISGALALYAAILEPAVHQVLLIDPPESHVRGPIFLNVLRHTDLPEAAALLAPRRLNFYARMPAAYEYTKGIYALEGKANHVFLTMSVEAVVQGRYDHNFASGY
jgi:cephalosporin-C deacetylase-like acetyl esterase